MRVSRTRRAPRSRPRRVRARACMTIAWALDSWNKTQRDTEMPGDWARTKCRRMRNADEIDGVLKDFFEDCHFRGAQGEESQQV